MNPWPARVATGSSRVDGAMTELHRAESHLATALLEMADRHRVDHEVYHVARDVAGWSKEHVRRLAEVAHERGNELAAVPGGGHDLLGALARKGAELTGRLHEPSLLLLGDLRHVHREAAGVSLDWEVLAQTAQALRDERLLRLAEDCHPETLRQMRWANAKVKELAAQTMVTG